MGLWMANAREDLADQQTMRPLNFHGLPEISIKNQNVSQIIHIWGARQNHLEAPAGD
jgi:hypothetical protein